MGLKIIHHGTRQAAINGAVDTVLKTIKAVQRPLLLLSGGSSLNVARAVLDKLGSTQLAKLTIGQIDERFVPIESPDSNWHQIEDLPLPEKKLKAIMPMYEAGASHLEVSADYSARLETAFEDADVTIGIYGVGTDGHIAGILPQSFPRRFTRFVDGRWVVSYKGRDFVRITTTDSVITRLDKLVLFASGKDKHATIKDLDKEITPRKHPAQLLKDARDGEAHVYTGR